MGRRSRGLNWGRMTAQYRNRQIRLAIARSKPRGNFHAPTINKVENPGETIITMVIMVGIAIILFSVLGSCMGW